MTVLFALSDGHLQQSRTIALCMAMMKHCRRCLRVSIFCSYSCRNKEFRDELETHLSSFLRRVTITSWHDRRIEAAEEWRTEIDSHIRSAHIILLLVSRDFLASDYCSGSERMLALKRHARSEVALIPIIVRPVDWKAAAFAHLPVFPSDGKPVIAWPDRGQVLVELAIAIRDLAAWLKPAWPARAVKPKQILIPGLVRMVRILQLN